MFEKFIVPFFFTGNDAVFSLYSSGKTNGTVFQSVSSVSCSVPILNGHPLKDAIIKIPIGVDITKYLMKLIGEHKEVLKSESEMNLVHELKNELSYVAFDYEKEINKAETTSEIQINYDCPNGNVLMLNKERFMCAELLFRPQNDGLNFEGIEKVIFNSIMKCKPEIQKELFSNIVLSGGISKLKGLKERIQKEIVNFLDNGDANVITNPYTNFSAWKGASMFASLSTSKQKYISHDEYNDSGSNIVNIKCAW